MNNFEKYDLTNPQKNIWNIEQLYGNTNINNITGIFSINQLLNIDILQQVMNKIIENNDALRINILNQNGTPYQYITSFKHEVFPVFMVKNHSEVVSLFDKIKTEKFDILDTKLYYIALIQDITTTYVCVKTHHIISDAWSLGQVAEQIKTNYLLISNNKSEQICKNPSYVNYINKNMNYFSSNLYQRDKLFWDNYIADISVTNNFDMSVDTNSKRLIKKIPNSTFNKISNYCVCNKITEYVFFQAVISLYFMKLFGMNHFVLGSPFINRKRTDNELETMGMFISTLPIKIDINSEFMLFTDFCKNISANNFSCFKHSGYPYTNIQEKFQENSSSSLNLYEVAFSYQINKLNVKINGDTGETTWLHNNHQNTPMLISYVNHFGEHKMYYDYLINLFSDKEINEIHKRLFTMINTIILSKNITISNIGICSSKDLSSLKRINNTGNIQPIKYSIIDRFYKMVKNYPNKTAIKYFQSDISYYKLNQLSDSVANFLLKHNVKQGEPVVLFFDNDSNFIANLLGVLKVGAYYIPILPEEEPSRIVYIVKNSNSKILLTEQKYFDYLKELKLSIPVLNALNTISNIPFSFVKYSNDSIAYLIYTSGTTGLPKGVMISHKNILSLLESINNDPDLKFVKDDVSISLLKHSFDASAVDIYTSLLNGGTLVLIRKEDSYNPSIVTDIIEKEKVTRCFTVHKWIEQIQSYGLSKHLSLRILGTGAEVLNPKSFKSLLKRFPLLGLYNTYGPTEATVFVTKHKVNKTDIRSNTSSIGCLMPFCRAVVVNSKNEVLPINAKGELVIYQDDSSCQNISKGYYNTPSINKDKFVLLTVPCSSSPVSAYKTGDIVKYNYNLELEFYGRQDDFIKVSGGFLVSLNEVNYIIQKILGNGIEIYTTSVIFNNSPVIILFIVKNKKIENISIEDLKQLIKNNITFYMNPKLTILIDKLPRNNNSKIDRTKLISIATRILNTKKEFVPPSTDIEKFIYKKIKLIVKSDFSINDDFFDDLNLDSLNITSLYTMLGNSTISMQDLYNYSSVKDLANLIVSESVFEQQDLGTIEVSNNAKKIDLSVILLTGMTGFVGINLLKTLSLNPHVHRIYCTVRDKLDLSAPQRFNYILNSYCSPDEIKLINSKTVVVPSSLNLDNFGMTSSSFNTIIKQVTTIINSAANVKHVGKYKDFYSDNVLTVRNLITVCTKYNISLVHLSTLSLAGFSSTNYDGTIFTENTLNVNQIFNKNPYLLSKYEAEKIILKAVNDGLINAKILRVGNIMPRVSDGTFQLNYDKNAFILALNELINLGIQNNTLLNYQIHLTPVDECCMAINSILNNNSNNTIYHLESDKPIKISDIFSILKEKNKNFRIVENEEFFRQINNNYNIGFEYLNSIFLGKSVPYSNVISNKLLQSYNFTWSYLQKEYLENIINIAKKIK